MLLSISASANRWTGLTRGWNSIHVQTLKDLTYVNLRISVSLLKTNVDTHILDMQLIPWLHLLVIINYACYFYKTTSEDSTKMFMLKVLTCHHLSSDHRWPQLVSFLCLHKGVWPVTLHSTFGNIQGAQQRSEKDLFFYLKKNKKIRLYLYQ